MSVHEQEVLDKGLGFEKEVEATALPMILDNLQISQYQHPIKSTVRELASNGWDSIQEKLVALKILEGEAQVDEYFIHRDDPMYRDSNWDRDYYDPVFLDMDKNEILIRYIDGGKLAPHSVEFLDYGVGLGGARLEGYFKLGYSTKRNSKLPLGKFGIGAKAAFSTGIEYYTMESAYNGQLFRFNVYAHKVDPIIPAINMETGKPNPHVTFSRGNKIYFEPYSGKNYVKVTYRVKSHHKEEYIKAVNSQLLYFDNVRFEVSETETGNTSNFNPKSEIVYEDEFLVMSNNNQFSKPHLIINNVCYGYIDWLELELQDRGGNVGIKVKMEDVMVNPSRESVVWNDKTRATVLRAVAKGIESASELLQDQLRDKTTVEWMAAVSQMNWRFEDSSPIARLAKFTDAKQFKVKRLVAGHKLTADDLMMIFLTGCESVELGSLIQVSKKWKYDRMPKSHISLAAFFSLDTYFTTEEVRDLKKRKYICYTSKRDNVFLNMRWKSLASAIMDLPTDLKKIPTDDLQAIWDELYVELKPMFKDFDAVQVPEGFKLTNKEEEEEIEEEVVVPTKAIKPKAPPKANLVIPIRNAWDSKGIGFKADPSTLANLNHREVFIGTFSDNDEEMGKLVAIISAGNPLGAQVDWTKDSKPFIGREFARIQIDNLNQSLGASGFNYINDQALGMAGAHTGAICVLMGADYYKKNVQNYYTLQEFFIRKQGKLITMSNALMNWYTARLIEPAVRKYSSLARLRDILPAFHTIYSKLHQHWIQYGVADESLWYNNVKKESLEQVIEFCAKVADLQHSMDNPDITASDIVKLSKELFNAEFEGGKAYDKDLVAMAAELEVLDGALPMLEIFANTDSKEPLNKLKWNETRKFTQEQEMAIREYLQLKSVI